MSTRYEIRHLLEAVYAQGVAYDKLLGIIVRLSQGQGQDDIIEAFRAALGEAPVRQGNYILFGNLALKFDSSDRLVDLYNAVPGTTERAEVVINSSSDL